eukprot:3568617-Rhodomonas_salina.5
MAALSVEDEQVKEALPGHGNVMIVTHGQSGLVSVMLKTVSRVDGMSTRVVMVNSPAFASKIPRLFVNDVP